MRDQTRRDGADAVTRMATSASNWPATSEEASMLNAMLTPSIPSVATLVQGTPHSAPLPAASVPVRYGGVGAADTAGHGKKKAEVAAASNPPTLQAARS